MHEDEFYNNCIEQSTHTGIQSKNRRVTSSMVASWVSCRSPPKSAAFHLHAVCLLNKILMLAAKCDCGWFMQTIYGLKRIQSRSRCSMIADCTISSLVSFRFAFDIGMSAEGYQQTAKFVCTFSTTKSCIKYSAYWIWIGTECELCAPVK